MRKTLSIVLAVVFFAACQDKKGTEQSVLSLSSDRDSISYSLGVNMASQLKEQGLTDIDEAIFRAAVQDVFEGEDSLRITRKKADQLLSAYYKQLRKNKVQHYLEQGRAFLKENKKKKGIVTRPSGLQYQILQSGNGKKPIPTDNVKCHYVGMLLDSTVVESTIKTGVPTIFPVNGVIPGIQEALTQMPTGSKWRLFIPTELAYGEKPFPGGKIKPNMALIYEIELLSIEKH